MSLNPLYIVSINLQEYLVDKNTGLPLSNGYIEFWQDTSRTTPKLVYQLTGSPPNYTYSALPNPVQLSGVGVPVNANETQVHIYYYPYDEDGNLQLYYISVYSEEDVLQYNLEGWPNVTESTSPSDQNNSTSNQLSNPQFVKVNFIPEEGLTIEFDDAISEQSYLIAPDWELIVTSIGSGTILVNQVPLAGSLNIPTNPPDKITLQPEGNNITNLILRQRLPNNPSIWSETTEGPGYLSGIMLIQSLDGQAQTISMEYVQSAGPAGPQVIVSGSTSTTGYQLLNNTVLLNEGSNTESGEDAEVFIDIILPTSGYYALTSLQVVGLNDDNIEVVYEQETTNRQIDHLFHYYKPPLDFKPIKSYLVGWDFPLNPAQPLGATISPLTGSSNYIWDQTILWQSSASAFSISRATGDNTGNLTITAAMNAKCAIVQYILPPEIDEILRNPLSSNIVLSCDQESLIGTISLWYTTTTIPNINSEQKSLILTTDDNGKPTTFNGTWTEIARSNYGNAQFTLSSSVDLTDLQNFGFNGWEIEEGSLDVSTVIGFAIVVGFETLENTNSIVIQSCSLVPGYISTIPAPQTVNEVLNDCRRYWEMSYPNYPVSSDKSGVKFALMINYFNGSSSTIYANAFELEFLIRKVSIPILTVYGYLDNSTADRFTLFVSDNNGFPTPNSGTNPISNKTFTTIFNIDNESVDRINFTQKTNASLMAFSSGAAYFTSGIWFHYTADSRPGVY